MRLSTVLAFLVFGGALAGAAPAPKSVEGDWETVWASPRRPWIFLVHFKAAGPGWTGAMSIRGFPDFPLREVRVESTKVHFLLPEELDSLAFDGTLGNGEIVGSVPEDGQRTPMKLTRVVPLPKPANRAEAWRQDLDFAERHVLDYDRSFSPRARQDFRGVVDRLKADVSGKNDAQILVALSHAVALADNAHTWLRLDPTRQGTFSTELPIRMWWFSDGPYVIRTAPAYRRALRCRVVAIDGHDVSEAKAKVAGLFAGNAARADYLSPIYLMSPDVLYGLGLIRSRSGASFTFEDPQGARFSMPVRSQPVARDAMAEESWQELSPLTPTGKPPSATALAADRAALPLYLRHPDQPYWFEFLPESGLLYAQYNRSHDAEKGPSFREFGDSFLAFVKQHPPRAVVVDLRLNSGGNLGVAKDFFAGLGGNPEVNRRGRLFVIVGHCTFSAGLYHAAQLKQLTQATFVGEEVGDRLDFWAEGGEIVLPNSQAAINYSNGFHRYSGVDAPEHRPYYEELSIPSLAPDIPVPATSKDYFSGKDPVLDAIEALSRRAQTESAPATTTSNDDGGRTTEK